MLFVTELQGCQDDAFPTCDKAVIVKPVLEGGREREWKLQISERGAQASAGLEWLESWPEHRRERGHKRVNSSEKGWGGRVFGLKAMKRLWERKQSGSRHELFRKEQSKEDSVVKIIFRRWEGWNFPREWWRCRTKNFPGSLRLSKTLTDFQNLSSGVSNGMKGRHDRWWHNSPQTQVIFFTFNFINWKWKWTQIAYNSLLLLVRNIWKLIRFGKGLLSLPNDYKMLIFFVQFLFGQNSWFTWGHQSIRVGVIIHLWQIDSVASLTPSI